MQVTDGEARVKPLVIFKGQGRGISLQDRDSRTFHLKAWCDEGVIGSGSNSNGSQHVKRTCF